MTTVQLLSARADQEFTANGKVFVRSSIGPEDFVVYGPYEDRVAGQYSVEFYVKAEFGNDVLGDPVVALLQVTCNRGATVLREERVLLSHLTGEFARFSIPFALHEPRQLE